MVIPRRSYKKKFFLQVSFYFLHLQGMKPQRHLRPGESNTSDSTYIQILFGRLLQNAFHNTPRNRAIKMPETYLYFIMLSLLSWSNISHVLASHHKHVTWCPGSSRSPRRSRRKGEPQQSFPHFFFCSFIPSYSC